MAPQYILSFEICSFIFLSMIAFHFFWVKQLPTTQNQIFSRVLICGLGDIFFNIIGSLAIENSQQVSLTLNLLLNTIFYILQLSLILFMFYYFLLISGNLTPGTKKYFYISLTPIALALISVLLNPFNQKIFYFDENLIYLHGEWYNILISIVFLYALTCIAVLIASWRKIRRRESVVSIFVLSIIGLILLFQNAYPQYLLSGLSITISMTMIYLVMQNPFELKENITGFFNRTALIQILNQNQNQRAAQGLIIFELENYQEINSLFGTEQLNAMVLAVAAYLSQDFPHSLIFRISAEQFALMPGKSESVRHDAFDIYRRFASSWSINGSEITVSALISYTQNTAFAQNSSDLINLIERSLSISKQNHEFLPQELNDELMAKIRRTISIEIELTKALNDNSLVVYVQPIYSMKDDEFYIAEALVRLRHPQYGLVSPAEFITLAEEKGFITRINDQVLNKVCAFIKEQMLYKRPGFRFITVNLSVIDLMSEGLTSHISRTIESYDLLPEFIHLEMTETAATQSVERLKDVINELRSKGIYFGLDDFGSGYANLTSLLEIPFKTIKIDKSMLMNNESDLMKVPVFNHSIQMIRELGFEIVVEGVETSYQVQMMKERGIDLIQGYFYSRPIPIEQYISFLDEFAHKKALSARE